MNLHKVTSESIKDNNVPTLKIRKKKTKKEENFSFGKQIFNVK
jgi:hypothetical protein